MRMIRLCWDICKLSSGLAGHFYTCCVRKFEIWHPVCVSFEFICWVFGHRLFFCCCHIIFDTIGFFCMRCVILWVCVPIGKLDFEILFATMGLNWNAQPRGRISSFCRIMFRYTCPYELFHSRRKNWDSRQVWEFLGLALSGFLVPHTHQGFGRSVQNWLEFGSRSWLTCVHMGFSTLVFKIENSGQVWEFQISDWVVFWFFHTHQGFGRSVQVWLKFQIWWKFNPHEHPGDCE